LTAYQGNRAGLNQVAIDASVIGSTILQLIDRHNTWEGVFAELLARLNGIASDAIKRSKEWPTTPRRLSGELRRIVPNLRAEGIDATFPRHTEKGTLVRLERVRKSPSTPSAQSDADKTHGLQPDDRQTRSSPNRQAPSGIVSHDGSNPLNSLSPDDAEGTDGVFATFSCEEDEERL
jgi:hypothetical protein